MGANNYDAAGNNDARLGERDKHLVRKNLADTTEYLCKDSWRLKSSQVADEIAVAGTKRTPQYRRPTELPREQSALIS
jgi:hypothetical protein